MGKDLSKYYTRETIRVIACPRQGDPTIEELQLEYLNKDDRLRIQAESMRDLIPGKFVMKPYPAALKKPHLGLWGNAQLCVIAKKHEKGGFQPMPD
ncbi:MAG: hypothetical protein AB7K24_24145, partial [Gemmataceae bacterium]